MKRCKTCKYWGVPYLEGFGPCGRCGSMHGYPDYSDSKAWASDSDSYRATLYTMPDFGCTEWAKKE
jgi:hypothetical protein